MPARPRSSRSTRSSRAGGRGVDLGPGRRTSATSRHTRRSSASRISVSASPTASMARVRPAAPRRRPWSSAWATASSGRATRLRAMVARKALRSWASRSSASRRGRGRRRRLGHGGQGPARVALAQRVDQLVDHRHVVVDGAGRRHLVERRQRVAGRARALAHGQVDGLEGHAEAGGLVDVAQVLGEHVGAEEPELEVLGAAADRGQHLLRVGGGQHEHDVAGRLLERLQQGVGRRRRQHVDLVDDVHLPPPGRAEGGPGHQVAHGVDAVVGRGVELVHVERRALLHLDARLAHAARLAVRRSVQFRALARMRAVVVLPVPRGPLNR